MSIVLLLIIYLMNCVSQLIGATGILYAASDAAESLFYLAQGHTFYQSAYTLKVSVAPANEADVVNALLVINFKEDGFAACTMCLVFVFLHNVI
jgi:hypothetical protein